MVFLVHRTDFNGSPISYSVISSGIADPSVVVFRRETGQNRVPMREVEHHIIPSLDMAEAFQTAIFVLDEGRIRLLTEYHVVSERDCERCLRHFGTVRELADEKMIPSVKGAFHRR